MCISGNGARNTFRSERGSRKFAFDDGEDQWPLIGSCKFRPSPKRLFSRRAWPAIHDSRRNPTAPFHVSATMELTYHSTSRSLNKQTSGRTGESGNAASVYQQLPRNRNLRMRKEDYAYVV